MQHAPDEPIAFVCNICDRENEAMLYQLTREDPSCSKCGSSVRLRTIIRILTTELFGHSLRISQIPRSSHLSGIGMSCWHGYANALARRMRYRNTFYHCEPRYDVAKGDASLDGSLDFAISTDVFEHVDPPVSKAFANVRKLLKPEGVLIFSVPFSHPGGEPAPTMEHFPDLHRYELEQVDQLYRLRNTTRTGEVQVFDELVFHGGPGSTLELRVFSEWSLLDELKTAGFDEVTIYSSSDLRHGIHWETKWSVPMAARVNRLRS